GHRGAGDERFNLCLLCVQSLPNDRAAQVPISYYPHRFTRLLVRHDRHTADVAITHDSCYILSRVRWHAADRIRAHDISDFHLLPPTLSLACCICWRLRMVLVEHKSADIELGLTPLDDHLRQQSCNPGRG